MLKVILIIVMLVQGIDIQAQTIKQDTIQAEIKKSKHPKLRSQIINVIGLVIIVIVAVKIFICVIADFKVKAIN